MKKWSILLLLSVALVLGCSALAWAADDYGYENNLALYPNWIATNTTGNLAGYTTTQPIFTYSTSGTATIRESVYIELPCDTDGDGLRDLVHAYIIRVSATNSGFISPVFMRVSPYRDGQPTYLPEWPVNGAMGVNPDTTDYTYADNVDVTKVKGKPRAADWPWVPEANAALGIPAARTTGTSVVNQGSAYTGSITCDAWQSYFVPRGYAYAYINSVGSRHAQGFSSCGGVEETLAACAFANWLNGKAKGYSNPQCTAEYVPTWSNGFVAIGGTSYNGTLPIAAACTGNPYIKAVMPVAAISSWYDYYRDNGAVIAPINCHGEDADVLTDYVFSRRISNGDTATVKNNNGTGSYLTYAAGAGYPANTNFSQALYDIYWNTYLKQINVDQDRNSGDYNWFWDERNYLATAGRVTAGIYIIHGTDDWNVKDKHFFQFWHALDEKAPNVVKKGFLSLGQHGHVNNQYESFYMPGLHLFQDHFLFGMDNGAEKHEVIPNINIANNNYVQNGTLHWDHFETLPIAGADYRKLYLTPTSASGDVGVLKNFAPMHTTEHFKEAALLTYTGQQPNSTIYTNWDHFVIGGNTSATSASWNALRSRDHSLAYYSEPLTDYVRLNGAVKVTITAIPDKGTGNLSAALVDLGPQVPGSPGTSNTNVPAALRTFGGEGNAGSFSLTNYTRSANSNPYRIPTRGSVDVQNPNPSRGTWMDAGENNFIPDYYFQTTKIVPGQAYEYTFTMEPTDYTFRPGQRIGIVIYSTDMRYTLLDPARGPGFDIVLGENTFVEIPLKYNIERNEIGSEIDNGDAPVMNIVGDDIAVFAGPQEVKMTYTLDRAVGAFGFNLPYDNTYLTPTKVELLKNGAPITMADGMFVVNSAVPGVIRTAFSADANISDLAIVVTYNLAADIPANLDLDLGVDVLTLNAFDPLMSGLFPLDYDVTAGIISTVKLGDVNRDGSITPEDAMLVLQWYVGIIELTKAQLLAADVNRDGVVDPIDSSLILRMVVGG